MLTLMNCKCGWFGKSLGRQTFLLRVRIGIQTNSPFRLFNAFLSSITHLLSASDITNYQMPHAHATLN